MVAVFGCGQDFPHLPIGIPDSVSVDPPHAAREVQVFPASHEDDCAGHEAGKVFRAFQFRDAVRPCAVVVGVELDCFCHSGSSPYDRSVIVPPYIVASRMSANMSSPVTCRPLWCVHRCGTRGTLFLTYTAPTKLALDSIWIEVPVGSRRRLRSPVIGSPRPGMVMLIVPSGGFAASRRAWRALLIASSTLPQAVPCGMSLFTRPTYTLRAGRRCGTVRRPLQALAVGRGIVRGCNRPARRKHCQMTSSGRGRGGRAGRRARRPRR